MQNPQEAVPDFTKITEKPAARIEGFYQENNRRKRAETFELTRKSRNDVEDVV